MAFLPLILKEVLAQVPRILTSSRLSSNISNSNCQFLIPCYHQNYLRFIVKHILFQHKVGQREDLELVDRVVLVKQSKDVDFRLDEHGVLMFRDRVCVPDVPELKKRILDEGHRSS